MVYTIPFPVIEGTNGMTPELNLVYHSQSANGLLGMGFHLSGLSAITRIGSNLYNDGEIKTIQFDTDDHFALDGNRLSLHSGTYGINGSEYRTERETFAKIVAHGTQANGPHHFVVYGSNGLIYEYGNSTDSRIEGEGATNDVLSWNLNKVSDRKGNYISYSYTENSSTGEVYPTWIQYTGYDNDMNGHGPYYSIFIEYEERPDSTYHYIAGGKRYVYQRVKSIKLLYYAEEIPVWSYDLGYTNSSEEPKYSYLNSITYTASDGTYHFNPMDFLWTGEGTSTHTDNEMVDFWGSTYVHDQNDYPLHIGDFDGDGRSDLIGFADNGVNVALANGNFHWDTKSSSFGKNLGYPGPQEFNCDGNPLTPKDKVYKYDRQVGDVNGDGLIDIVGFGDQTTVIHISDGNNFVYYDDIPDFDYNSTYATDFNSHPRYVIDVNGDGMDDIVGCFDYEVRVALSNGAGFDPSTVWLGGFFFVPGGSTYPFYLYWDDLNSRCKSKYPRIFGDINGDGMADLVAFGYFGTHVYISNGHSFNFYTTIQGFGEQQGWEDMGKYPRYIADVNGDGLGDIVGYASSEVTVSLATGSGFTTPKKWTDHYGYDEGHQEDSRLVADVNGDGMSDLLVYTDQGVEAAISNGDQFCEPYVVTAQYTSPLLTYKGVFDHNGDAMPDPLTIWTYDDNCMIFYSTSTEELSKVNQVNDSYDNSEHFTYLHLTSQEPGFYQMQAGFTISDPVEQYRFPLIALRTYSTQNITNTYSYKDILVHRKGKGFLGFDQLITESDNTVITTKTKQDFELNTTYYNNHLIQVDNYINGNLISESLFDPTYINKGGKNYHFYYCQTFSKSYAFDGMPPSASKTQRSIDNYGNIEFEYRYTDDNSNHTPGDPASSFPYRSYTNSAYINDVPNWLFLIDDSRTEVISPDDPQGKLRYTDFNYYPISSHYPLPEWVEETPNDDPDYSVKTSFDYDQYGNVIYTKKEAPNYSQYSVTALESTFDYDVAEFGRFLTTKYETGDNNVLMETDFTYDPVYGTLIREEDANGIVTDYEYDDFGRLSASYAPGFSGPIQTKYALRWIGVDPSHPDAPAHSIPSLYYSWSQSEGTTESYSFFDSYDRERRSVSILSTSEKIYSDKEFNNLGQLILETDPYYSSFTNEHLYTEYVYDDHGRIVETFTKWAQNGSALNGSLFDYNGYTTTVTQDPSGNTQVTSKNVLGQDVEVTDAKGNTISYVYDAWGNPIEIINGSISTIIEYDPNGLQSKLEDPDAGTTFYKYNPLGQLVYQKDANVNEFTMTYDQLGRIKTKFDATQNQTISYSYDNASNALGKPISVSGGDLNYSISYTYNTLGHLLTETETFDNQTFQKAYLYDNLNRLSIEQFPSGNALKYNYDNVDGKLMSIEDNFTSDLYWTFGSMTPLGTIDNADIGNGNMTVSYEFEKGWHFLERIHAGGVMDYEYDYDYSTGNMTRRADMFIGLEETFGYDAQTHALDDITFNGNTFDINYDPFNGNITDKYDAGTYTYDPASRPHAVTEITTCPTCPLPSEALQSVTYNSENNLESINHYFEDKDYILHYGGKSQRIKSEYLELQQTVRTKYYALGNHEVIIDDNGTTERDYVGLPDGTSLVFEVIDGGQPQVYYILRDHLGSSICVLDENGTMAYWNGEEQRYSYDAWGRRRNADDWTYNLNANIMFDRGFTGHEHLDAFGLINMNGRTYDPIVGRFLMPDNYVAGNGSVVAFNRYAYCLNNPLSYVDPDGEFPWLLAAAIVGGYLGGSAANNGELNPLAWDYKDPGTYVGMATGALFGYVGAYGIVNPGTVTYAFGVTGPSQLGSASLLGGGLYVTGSSSDWSLEWNTSAGGFGKLDLKNDISYKDVFAGSNEKMNIYTGGYRNTNPEYDPDFAWKLMSMSGGRWLPQVNIYANRQYDITGSQRVVPGSGRMNQPYWWGRTDLAKNEIVMSRLYNEGINTILATVLFPIAVIAPIELPALALRPLMYMKGGGWHYGRTFGYHYLGRQVAGASGELPGFYYHFNISGRHLILNNHILRHLRYFKFLK